MAAPAYMRAILAFGVYLPTGDLSIDFVLSVVLAPSGFRRNWRTIRDISMIRDIHSLCFGATRRACQTVPIICRGNQFHWHMPSGISSVSSVMLIPPGPIWGAIFHIELRDADKDKLKK